MLREGGRGKAGNWQAARYCWRLAPGQRGVPACLSYIVEGNRIWLPGRPGGVQFDFPIGDVVESEEAIVVCLAVPEGRRRRENVYALDREGNLRWRIKPQGLESRMASYVGLSLCGGLVRLHGGDGSAWDIDPGTGALMAGPQRGNS